MTSWPDKDGNEYFDEVKYERIELVNGGFIEIKTFIPNAHIVTAQERFEAYSKLHSEPKNKELAAKYKEELARLYDNLPDEALNPPNDRHAQFIKFN